jgi:hypothetical protein
MNDRRAPGKPVLITGSHRSGSTWLAHMLALAEDTLVVEEPFNIAPWAYALDGLAGHWFTYAPALPRGPALKAFDKVLACKTGRVFPRRQVQRWLPPSRRGRLIIKDPIACVSSEWLAENFELEVILLVRHPAAFAASLKRLQWEFPFDHLLEQDSLMNEHLQPYRAEIEHQPAEVVAQAALLWKCLYSVLFTYLDRNPNWIVRTHEELSLNPIAELKELYEILGLKWTGPVERRMKEHTKQSNPTTAPRGVVHQMRRNSAANTAWWKKALTREEIACLRDITYETSGRYYSERDW